MTTTTYFQIEQPVHDFATWEPVENSRVDTIEEARADMAALEADLGWRNLRIVEREETDDAITSHSVIEYGTAGTADPSSSYQDPVVVEIMPDHLRDSHRAAGNWGTYPANGAQRVIVERVVTRAWIADADADCMLGIEADEYDHIVRDANADDFAFYEAQ